MSKKTPKVARLQLKPTTVSTGFGSGTYDPRTGNAGYTLDPQLAELRDYFYGAAEGMTPTEGQMEYARGIGESGRSFLDRGINLDIGQVTQDYFDQGSRLLAPNRAQEESRLADTLFKTGRTGAAVGRGEGYVNPEQFALLSAREEADAMRMFGAEDRARSIQGQDIQRGLGLLDTSNALTMQPYGNMNTLFGLGANIEGLGMDVLGAVKGFAPMTFDAAKALQENQQARNNAAAARSNASFGRVLANKLVDMGTSYITGGFSNMMGGSGGGSPFSSFSNFFSGSSPSSSPFNDGGFGNMVGTFNNTYSPSSTNIGMATSAFPNGYVGPANFGGGTMGPSFY